MTASIRADASGTFGALTVNGVDKLLFDAAGNLTGTATPPQFDNSLKLASTAFLQRMGMQASGITYVAANTTLTPAVAGGSVLVTGAGGWTITLPTLASMPQGTRIEFYNNLAPNVTVQRQGTDFIYGNSSNSQLTNIVLQFGDTMILESNGSGAGNWLVVGGSVNLAFSGLFASLPAGSGYQRLPSGLIVQWGSIGTSASATTPVSFPVAFPTALYSLAFGSNGVTGNGAWTSGNSWSNTGFSADGWFSSATRAALTLGYLAIGK